MILYSVLRNSVAQIQTLRRAAPGFLGRNAECRDISCVVQVPSVHLGATYTGT